MSWWGTLIGVTFGFLLGGPIGALIGAAFGSSFGGVGRGFDRGRTLGFDGGRTQDFDRGPTQGFDSGPSPAMRRERAQMAFFAATFGVMGHVAKADGRVTADEIRLAEQVMDQLGLNVEQRRAARSLFDQGKSGAFPLDDVLDQLRSECLRGANIRRMFLEIQFQAAWADGGLHPEERLLLLRIAARLGLSRADYIEIERMFASAPGARADGPSLESAYEILGVSPDSPDAEVKRAYRRLMNRHHPDKLAARGLPEEMMRAATERTQQIKAAWDTVKAARAA